MNVSNGKVEGEVGVALIYKIVRGETRRCVRGVVVGDFGECDVRRPLGGFVSGE